MALREEYEKFGNWLFRWRSYVPLFLVALFLFELKYFRYPWNSESWDRCWEIFCLAISFFGLGIRVVTIGSTPKRTSGRNTISGQVADVLNTSGMYSVVRNPLYLGNFFIVLGISLFMRSWWMTLTVVLAFFIYYEGIMFAEEEFLRRKFGAVYLEWAANTPLFVPRFKNWRPPSVPFSLRKALRREYSALFAIIVSFTILEIISDFYAEGRFVLDPMWAVIFAVGLIIYVLLRTLKKKSHLLNDRG